MSSDARVTIVLPHREMFSPDGAGAVAMIVRRIAAARSRYASLVIGPLFEGAPFPGVPFMPLRVPRRLPLSPTQSYAIAVARALARLPAGPIEVYNKPDVALWLARAFPRRPVTLFLQNDPRTMRGARSASSRGRLMKRLARVVTASDFLRRALLDGVDPSPNRAPLVIHNALDLGALPPARPPEGREKLILFAGRVVPDKAPDAFVAACAQALPQLPGWRAEVIGAAGFSAGVRDSDFIGRLRPAAAFAGIAMTGFLPNDKVMEALAQAAIAVVPSRWEEPFGLAALEAMASGAALACSCRGGLREVAGEACLLFDPDDVEQGTATLLRLARDDALRASLAEAGLRRARAHFDGDDAIARLDALRDSIVADWTDRSSGRTEAH